MNSLPLPWSRRFPRFLLASLLSWALVPTGCQRPFAFSPVLEGGFDPIGAFRRHGYGVQADARGEGIRNAEAGYGWQSWCGILVHEDGSADVNAVARIVRDEVNVALKGEALDELTDRRAPGRPASAPLTGLLRYNHGQVHGDLHVWLTPIPSNAAVAYVLYVREDRTD